MPEKPWFKRYGEEIVIGLLITAISSSVGYLFDKASRLAGPIFYGSVVASLFLMVYLLYRLTKRVPKPKIVPTVNNIEQCVRGWLDNHRVTVKNDPVQDCYWRLVITLDSGCILSVLRSKSEYPEYVQIFCALGIKGDNLKLLDQFSQEEKAQVILDIQLELARAKVGYSGLVDPPEDFFTFQRVPIYPTLNEFVFMNMVGNVEAARNLVSVVFQKAMAHKTKPKGPQQIYGTPMLKPPAI